MRLQALSQFFLIKAMLAAGLLHGNNEIDVMEQWCAKYAEPFRMLAEGALESAEIDTEHLRSEFKRVTKQNDSTGQAG